MQSPFAKSISTADKCKRLQETAGSEDTLAILIHADPDSMASALALKRFFWRKVKRVNIVRINKIDRADNLAFVRLWKIQLLW